MKQVPANTLIMSFKLSIGKTAITTSPAYTNEAIMAFLDKHVVPLDLDYLYHLFSSRDWLSDTNIAVMGATLNKKTLGAQKIVVPALTEQKEIAEHLAAVQSQISVAEQMLDKADELIQSRFVEMFERDKQIKHVRLDHISLVGSSHRVFKSEILTSGVPFYRGSEISSLSRGDSASASLFISYEHYEELISQSGKPEIGDLLLPSICDKGQIWRVNTNDPFYFKDGRVLWIRPDKTIINSEYLKRAICSVLYKDFIKLTSGTTFAELKIFILKGIEVPLPPLALQNEFAEFVTQVESLKTTARQQLDRLNTLYDSLAQRYFAE